ncbi:PilN domain-containing protein [Thermocoleostomius sinensis]|jgi:type IV pilus assembly protein PilN|uniref:PilN domain-containing protein n=1 Tax=Thermocoleostomius sinensis A174 TaxID=2016057 RepID=A0A9E8ZFJ4_9CYAN|nr:PilN domain-containing protein [Thermocoleostomius sinensis]WAL62218.1 PilN domain-containing protein [Thermocoleostomius sinensis A174]
MYSLDINFLNDRHDRPTEASVSRPRRGQRESPLPFYIGLAVAIALPAMVGGVWLLLQSQNRQLEQQQAELDSQLTALNAQLEVINTIESQIQAIDTENRALATVFDRIKPWSAVLQDIRGRVPSNVQISNIEQLQVEAESPPPTDDNGLQSAATEPSPSRVRIRGYARSFNDVNDFVLTLKRSPFLNTDTVQLSSSQLIDNPTQVEIANELPDREIQVELPRVVEYTIEGSLTNLPASALLQDLERTLSVGLATRIQALRDRGVIQP